MRKIPHKTGLVLGITLLALIAAAAASLALSPKKQATPSAASGSNTSHDTAASESQSNNKSPANTSTQIPDSIRNQTQKVTPTPETQGGKVTPVITYSGFYDGSIEAAGYVVGVLESTGTCTYTFSQGTTQITKNTSGMTDSNHTTCKAIKIPRSEFPAAGSWKVVLSYSSASSSGSSGEQTLTIQ